MIDQTSLIAGSTFLSLFFMLCTYKKIWPQAFVTIPQGGKQPKKKSAGSMPGKNKFGTMSIMDDIDTINSTIYPEQAVRTALKTHLDMGDTAKEYQRHLESMVREGLLNPDQVRTAMAISQGEGISEELDKKFGPIDAPPGNKNQYWGAGDNLKVSLPVSKQSIVEK